MKLRRWITAAVVAAALVLLWRRCGSSTAPPSPAASRSGAVSMPAPFPEPSAKLAASAAPEPAAPEPLLPIIDQVIVERDSLCDGEETLVTVKAHTPGNREDAFLHYMVGPELGASVALRVFATDDSEGAGPGLVVRVFGRNNVAVEAPVPPIRVRACKPTRRLHIASRLLPNTSDELELVAKIVNVTAAVPMTPIEARWQFGDGDRVVSVGPVTTHDYGARPQDTLYSQFVVTCEVVAADGEHLVGRTSLQLLNPAFEHLAYKRIVLLTAAMTPRFPEVDDHGVVRQRVHVSHRHRAAVRITRVLRYPHNRDTSVDSAGPETLDPVRLFGTDTISPAGVDATVELAASSPVAMYEYVLEGESADGYRAAGSFAVMRPPARPTKANSDPVVDPLLKSKILRARQLLHQDYVTDEDLYRLAARGTFDDLIKAAAEHPAPLPVPPPLPPR